MSSLQEEVPWLIHQIFVFVSSNSNNQQGIHIKLLEDSNKKKADRVFNVSQTKRVVWKYY